MSGIVSFSDPKELSDDGLKDYLTSIVWDDDHEYTDQELRSILNENIDKYFRGGRTQDFILGLGRALYQEAFVSDDTNLLSACCEIETLSYERVDNKKVNKSKEEIDKLIRWAQNQLNS